MLNMVAERMRKRLRAAFATLSLCILRRNHENEISQSLYNLFCLTLSMTILSACGNKEPSANSNPSSASGGGTQSENAQNSDAPEEDAPSIELADMG